MSFFKSLCLAIFATIFLTYVLGTSFIELHDVDVYVAMSVFGSLIFVAMLLLGGGAMLLVGVFWPIFLVAGVIWLVTRDKRTAQY